MHSRLLENYLNYLRVERGLSPNTVEAYSRDVKAFIDFFLTASQSQTLKAQSDNTKEPETLFDPNQIDKAVLSRYLQHLYGYLSPRTVTRKIVSLKSLFRYLLLDGHVQHDPTETLDSPRTWRTLPKYLTREEIESLLAAPELGLIDDVVVDQGGGVDELNGRRQGDVALAPIACHPGTQQQQDRPHPLACAGGDVGVDLVDDGNVGAKRVLKGGLQRFQLVGDGLDDLVQQTHGGPQR